MFNTANGNALTKLSANGASANAYTSTNITAYYFECVDRFDENLETLLEFVSVPFFTDENVETERGIIEQEILMCNDDPDHCLYYGFTEALFEHNALRFPIAGTVESIQKITAQTLLDCFNVFYHPSNMVLCVTGDIDTEDVRKAARKILPDGLIDKPLRNYGSPEKLTPAEYKVSKEMDVSLPIFLAGCKVPPPEYGHDSLRSRLINAMAMDLLAGHSSKLYFRLYNDGLVNSDFSGTYDFSHNAAYAVFGGEAREPMRVFDEVKKEIRTLSEVGVNSDYFDRVKRALLGGFTRSLNSFEGISNNIIDGHFLGYDAFNAFNVLSGITRDDIIHFYREHLLTDNMAISIITPRG